MSSAKREYYVLLSTVGMAVATVLAILIAYGSAFGRFPWFRLTVLMTGVSLLAGLLMSPEKGVMLYRNGGRIAAPQYRSMLYGLFGVPVVFLLLYPGPSALGESSDAAGGQLVVALGVIHAIGCHIVATAGFDGPGQADSRRHG